MLTLLHAADFHLDSPFRSLPPREAQARRAAQRGSLEHLRALAAEHRVDLVVLPGDLFDSREVYPETLEALVRALGAMPCPVVIAPGNHDYYDDLSPYAKPIWPDNVHIFSSEAVTALPFPDLGATVYGCAFTGPFRDDDPLAGFHAPDDGAVAIGCFHGEPAKSGRYAPIAPESLAQSGLAYAALGHIHAFEAHPDAPVPWAFSGCTQGRGFDELGDKGAVLVTVDAGRVRAQLLPLPGPRYRELSVPAGADPAAALRAALGDDCRDDYVRLTLTGESAPLELAALERLGEGLCRVLDLRDQTRAPLDVWARCEEETLTGYFLREMRARLDSAAQADRPALQAALRCGLAALEGRETPQW